MAENYIKDKLFHYNGVDYSIFAKYVDSAGEEHDVVVKRVSASGREVSVWDVTVKGWTNLEIAKLTLKPFGEKGGKRRFGGGRAKFDDTDAELKRECAGWKIYFKTVTSKDGKISVVTKVVKNKETKPRSDWDNVRGDITVNGGVKWNKVDQTFERWNPMSEEDLDTMCDLLKKYYGNGEEEKEAPPVPAPETPKPTDNSLLLLFQRFDTPEKLAENPLLAEQKMNCLLQIDAMLESFTDAERKDGDFIRKYLKNRIWFVSPISGEAFIPEQIHIKGEASWAVYYESLSNILSLGGVPYFYIGDDAIEGLKVSVDGEANYDGKKELYQKYKDEYAEVQDEEDWRSGALLKYTQWYGLAYAVEIAKNFITNHYVASFKFPKFTEEFEKLFTKIEVQYEQKNYKGETSLTNAEVYYRNGDGKWLYILQSEDGYAAMYTNDFMQGYNLVKNMVTETDGYLSYVKDVSGFEESLMSATRPYEQLLQKYPQIFGAGKELNIPQMILDLKLLLSLEDDPIEYAWLKQKLEDLELLQSFP